MKNKEGKREMVLACGSGRCGEIITYTIIIKRFLFLLSRPGITKTVKSHTIQKLFFYLHTYNILLLPYYVI
nr:MAG TPA: hypothetical protein [Caudoviricetes sp.]